MLMDTPHDNDRPSWPDPDEPACFAAADSLRQHLLHELSEPAELSNGDLSDLLGRRPSDATRDPDVAGAMFEDFRNRSLRGEPISRTNSEPDVREQRDSMASLFRRRDVLRSITAVSEPSALTFALPKVGDELFGYRLQSQLGQGAFARVFLAEQSELAGRLVALKTSDLTGSEPQTLAQLQHTNIVPIYSVHEDTASGIRAVCMPYFGGASLSQILKEVWRKSDQPTSGAAIVDVLTSTFSPHPACRGGSRDSAPLDAAAGSSRAESREPLGQAQWGNDLARLSDRDFPSACAWIVARLAEGLQHAHDRRVLHRDIKPANVLIGGDGTPMLLDFNLSHDENQLHGQVEATLGGTVAYMAPEHLRALNIRSPELIAKVDERSDLYGLGMVLFEMITGHNPFEQMASYAVVPILVEAMAAERTRSIPSLRKYRDDVPWGLESIVRKCLQPDAAKRYQRADELAEDINCLLNDLPLRHAPELSRAEQLRKWTRRHPKLASSGLIVLAASLVLTLGGSILLGTRTRLAAAQTRVIETEGAEARELQRRFEVGTLKALCLVNTHSDLRDHAERGRKICEETLSLFGILDDPNWQDRAIWKRLSENEQRKLAEDARELLLMLAGTESQNFKSQISNSKSSALALLDRAAAIRDLPPSAAVFRARAALLRQMGESEQAAEADRHANELPPATARDFYLLATTHLQAGDPDRFTRAIQELRQALQRDPRHYWSWMQKGLCHLELGESQLALADFSVCVGLWPEFAWGHFNRAFALDQLGQKGAAIVDYSAALDRDADLEEAIRNRGIARLELGKHDEALADFDRLIEARGVGSLFQVGEERSATSPRVIADLKKTPDPVLFALRGQALAGLHRNDEADAAFALAMTADQLANLPIERQHQLLCSFGFAVVSRRPADAEKAFARIPSDDPKYPEALYGRGLIATNSNRMERATELFGKALELRPHFGEARRFRAILLARLGRIAEAITEINTALQAAPKSGAALYAAACVTALAAEQAPSPAAARQATGEAIRFLRQALANGYGQHAATDDDLKVLRQHPEFERLLLSPSGGGGAHAVSVE